MLHSLKFNFNKSCIWISTGSNNVFAGGYLTLTRVVFECAPWTLRPSKLSHLTLTRVVFECDYWWKDIYFCII